MRRREFIALLGGAAAHALPAAAQQQKRLPVVALVFIDIRDVADMAGPDPVFPVARAFVHGLRDLGWIDGRTVVIERHSSGNDPQRAPAIFAGLLARGADVIALGGARWLHEAALAATRTIPIVALFSEDPVAAGRIASLARPGGNLTGVVQATGPEFFAKRLQLLLELAPRATRVAFLAPSGVLEQFRSVAPPGGVTIVPVEIDVATQFDAAFATILRERADALMVGGSAVMYGNAERLVAFAAANRLPAMHAFREAVDGGGLMSYATNVPGIFRQMARLTARFLEGARPGDIPAELPVKFELVINLKTAAALGLAVPPSIMARADEVIE